MQSSFSPWPEHLEPGMKILSPQTMEDIFEVNLTYGFAAALKLSNYRWLSYQYLERDTSRGHPLPPGVLAVG